MGQTVAFGLCEAIFGRTRDTPEEFTVTHLVRHDGKFLAARLPAAGILKSLGKSLQQRHINAITIRIFVTEELVTQDV